MENILIVKNLPSVEKPADLLGDIILGFSQNYLCSCVAFQSFQNSDVVLHRILNVTFFLTST